MTIRDLFDNCVEVEGWVKVQCWENEDYPNIYYEGYSLRSTPEKYLDREIRYIFPFMTTDIEAAICIELCEED